MDRKPGEPAEAWTRRASAAHQAAARRAKIERGTWLPADEYQRQTGRPGRALSDLEVSAARSTARSGGAAPAAGASRTPPDADPPPVAGRAWTEHGQAVATAAVIGAAGTVLRDLTTHGRKVPLRATAVRAAHAAGTSAAKTAMVAGVREGLEVAVRRTVQSGAARGVATAVVKQTAASAARTALRTSAIGQAAALVVEQGLDTVQLARGRISGAEYGARSAGNVGNAAGGLGGAALGAAIGTAIFPGVGTAVGTFVGGLGGSVAAQKLLRRILG